MRTSLEPRDQHVSPTGRRTQFILIAAGVVLVQLAWIFSVPPFWGLDEIDHAYRAAELAGGGGRLHHEPAADGTRELVQVPEDLAAAGGAVCEAQWAEMMPERCSPAADAGRAQVLVPSSAARYNPVFYVLIGTPSRLFDGVESLYAMRLVAALGCALLLAWALLIASRHARTSWPLVAILVASTPTWWYSTSVAAPNGVEMAAGMLLWSSLLALANTEAGDAGRRHLVHAATVAAVTLATVRSLGPLWLVLTVATAAVAYPHLVQGWRHWRRPTVAPILVVVLAVAAGAGWTLWAGTNAVPTSSAPRSPWLADAQSANSVGDLAVYVGFWVAQAIAVFPDLKMFAPLPVYLLVGGSWIALCVGGWWVARPRTRRALVAAVLVATAIPLAMTVMTYSVLGVAWQGRYALPYVVGVALLCGHALDRRSKGAPWVAWLAAAGLALGTVIGQLGVLDRGLAERAPGVTDLTMPAPLIVAATILGFALLTWQATRSRTVLSLDPTGREATQLSPGRSG